MYTRLELLQQLWRGCGSCVWWQHRGCQQQIGCEVTDFESLWRDAMQNTYVLLNPARSSFRFTLRTLCCSSNMYSTSLVWQVTWVRLYTVPFHDPRSRLSVRFYAAPIATTTLHASNTGRQNIHINRGHPTLSTSTLSRCNGLMFNNTRLKWQWRTSNLSQSLSNILTAALCHLLMTAIKQQVWKPI